LNFYAAGSMSEFQKNVLMSPRATNMETLRF